MRGVWRVAPVVLTGACSLLTSLDGLRGTDGGDAQTSDVLIPPDADAAVSPDASDGGRCASLHGPPMVFVPVGAGFCIDSTEVTTTDYAAFLTAVSSGAPIATPPGGVCGWNGTVSPRTTGGCTADTVDPSAHPNRPITCINWCDAYAYCAWAGKRLCGAVGGGSVPYGAFATGTNQSYVACSANTTRQYPYGNAYVKGACNTLDLYAEGGAAIADIGEFDACVGGYPSIHDITGNVEEWFDSCELKDGGGDTDLCHEFGDSFAYVVTGYARCDNDDSDPRSAAGLDKGIRCCSL